jgi:murein DD-endopeptidase MepM/ murein hydrolase activator NlpD
MKLRRKKYARFSGFAIILGLLTAGASGQGAPPGPYEYLPFDDAYIVEAFTDLLPGSNSIADWTGWTSKVWESPNAYNDHGGNDFSMATGTPVYAATTGTVVELETNRPENDHNTSYYYGNFVRIAADGLSPTGDQITVRTAHLLPTVQVTVGQHVNAGQLIGYSDNTGQSTSEHCHVQSALAAGDVIMCPFYNAHFKYPIMFNPNAKVQVGHVVKVNKASTPIRDDRFDSSTILTTAYQNQMYFASFAKRGYYRIFIPNDTKNRSGWIKAVDVDEVYSGGTVIQALPDPGTYIHKAQLSSTYPIRSAANSGASIIGQIRWGGGRFVADQTAAGGWYHIPVPGSSATSGWVQANSQMVVYPQLYNPTINLANRPQQDFPFNESFGTLGLCTFGRPKFDRCSVVNFSPASPGGDGKALFLTDAINFGSGIYDTVSVGKPNHRDYFVESDVYFRFNPSYGTFERYGVFLRDDGFGGFDETFEGKGNCYAMTWDSDDGYLRCCKIVDAAITDFSPTQIYVPSSGWHKLRIEAVGTNIKYYLDGVLKVSVNDSTFPSGSCGVGYTSHIGTTYPPARGAYFDNFKADSLP